VLVTEYRVVPEESSVSAVLRPVLDGRAVLTATIDGRIELDDPSSAPRGTVRIRLDGTTDELVLDVSTTVPEVDRGPAGEVLLRGSTTRPAGTFGLAGPPLLNPTVVLRWRAVLAPVD
jgi:hypothetical protein